jgi:transposase
VSLLSLLAEGLERLESPVILAPAPIRECHMWTIKNRPRYDRDKLRYPSDLTDEEWSLVEPLIPPAKHGGRRREVNVREVVNAIMYLLSTGCQWRYIPKDLAPRSTVHDYFVRWDDNGTVEIHHALYVKCRELMGREANPTACVIDSQSVKSTEKGGPALIQTAFDADKKIKGKKRHIVVDMVGLLLHAVVHPADIQDRDGGILVLSTMFGLYPFLSKLFTDAGYQGPQFRRALAEVLPHLTIEIVKRSDKAVGFEVLPRRWIVERTLAWLNRCRRLAKDFENLTRSAVAFIRLASIRLTLRKLCNPS